MNGSFIALGFCGAGQPEHQMGRRRTWFCLNSSCPKLIPGFKILASGCARGELIWDPVKIWIIRAGRASKKECCQQFTWLWRHRPMYSRWLTGSIPGTVNLRRSRRLLRSAAIRKPAADPLYSETPIFHTEHLKSELCTLLFKEREKAGERRKIFLKISGRDWFPDGRGYLVCLPGNQFRWSLIEQRSLVCSVKYCIAFCETENFQILLLLQYQFFENQISLKYQTCVRALSSHIHRAQCIHRLSKLIKGSSIPSITNTLIREDLIWKTYN